MTTHDPGNVVEIAHVTQRFGDVCALDDVSLSVRRGEFLTLLGPSGCGKSTLLRTVAGFEVPTHGRVLIDDHDMAGVPPNRRPVNMVFQRPTLFPHLDVAGNVAFGLRLSKVKSAEVARRVAEVLSLVRLDGYGRRRAHELSGGQQQRVALARALVNQPTVLLLDEPLSALDLRIRLEMEVELRRVHRESGATFIYVTHDQREALALSDRIAVLDRGTILQAGTPAEVFDEPRSPFVASFVGAANVIAAEADGQGGIIIGGQKLPAGMAGSGSTLSGQIWVVVRPQVASFTVDGGLAGCISDVAFRGIGHEYEVTFDGLDRPVKVETASETARSFGERVQVTWPGRSVRILPRGGPDD